MGQSVCVSRQQKWHRELRHRLCRELVAALLQSDILSRYLNGAARFFALDVLEADYFVELIQILRETTVIVTQSKQ